MKLYTIRFAANTATGSQGAPTAPAAKPTAKAKIEKTVYPGLADDNGKLKLLESWPTDFDPKAHKPLKRGNFKCESIWYDHRAEEFDRKAKEAREEAENIRKSGGAKERAKLKKLEQFKKKAAELEAQLAAMGIEIPAE